MWPPRLAAVPAEITESVQPLGIPNSRFRADTGGPTMVREAKVALTREWAANPQGALAPASYLGLSGGSDNGAFGAGLLVGWTETGTRPEFKIVAGVSTRALIAPFAFLGASRHDLDLRKPARRSPARDVYEERCFAAALLSDALANRPDGRLDIDRYCTPNYWMTSPVEHDGAGLSSSAPPTSTRRGQCTGTSERHRRERRPAALDPVPQDPAGLRRHSGGLPPVLIEVELDGRHYQEMHVDGGAVAQTFLIPSAVGHQIDLRAREHTRLRTAYVIRNARLDPEWASVDRRLLSITGRAISTLIHYSGYNDTLRILLDVPARWSGLQSRVHRQRLHRPT